MIRTISSAVYLLENNLRKNTLALAAVASFSLTLLACSSSENVQDSDQQAVSEALSQNFRLSKADSISAMHQQNGLSGGIVASYQDAAPVSYTHLTLPTKA